MLTQNINYDGFEYVLERKQPTKVCFGSSAKRKTIFSEGKDPTPGPLTYAPEKYTSGIGRFLSKPRSKKGVGGLASSDSRFSKVLAQVPSPTRYNVGMKPKEVTKAPVPFGSKISREMKIASITPGPGAYDITAETCRRSQVIHNFGDVYVVPATECICTPYFLDVCSKCSNTCDNDYWHQNYTVFLCNSCMTEEQALHEMYLNESLSKFRKLRNCSYMHNHESTSAAIRLLPSYKITKKKQVENYLNLYFKCF